MDLRTNYVTSKKQVVMWQTWPVSVIYKKLSDHREHACGASNIALSYSAQASEASDSYIAHLTGTKPDQPRFTIIRSGSWSARVNGAAALMRPSTERANKQLDPRQQLANTPPPQSTTPGLHPVSIHQMAPPKRTPNCSLLLIYRPGKDLRLSWPSWLTCSGEFTHIVVTRWLQAERRTGSGI